MAWLALALNTLAPSTHNWSSQLLDLISVSLRNRFKSWKIVLYSSPDIHVNYARAPRMLKWSKEIFRVFSYCTLVVFLLYLTTKLLAMFISHFALDLLYCFFFIVWLTIWVDEFYHTGLAFAYQLLYLLDATGFYSLGLHVLGIHVCRATGQELVHI